MKSKQRLAACLTIFCLLSSFIPISSKPLSSFSFLAPTTEDHFFSLTDKKREQIKRLIQTLDQAKPLIERRYAGTSWLTEDTKTNYQKKIQTSNKTLIPRLGFYEFLGKENRAQLRKRLNEAIEQNKPLPKQLELTCNKLNDEPVGLYRFLSLIQELKEEELKLFDSVTISSFHRDRSSLDLPKDHLNKTLVTLTGDDLKKGIAAFRFYGDKAKRIADLLFQKGNPVAMDLQFKWQKKKSSVLNLLELADEPDAAVLTGIQKVVLNTEELLQLPQRSQQNLIWEIVYKLTAEGTTFGQNEAKQSALLLTNNDDILKSDFAFYNLIGFLANTATALPTLDDSDQLLSTQYTNHVATLHQNILNALQKNDSKWFNRAVGFLGQEERKNILSFLAATGWVDQEVEQKLKRGDPAVLTKVKSLLTKGIVATKETVELNDEAVQQLQSRFQATWPKNRGIVSSWDQLEIFCFLKHKLFFSNHSFNPATTALAFLTPAFFFEAAAKAQTIQKLSRELTVQMGLQHAVNKVTALYNFRIAEKKSPETFFSKLANDFMDYRLRSSSNGVTLTKEKILGGLKLLTAAKFSLNQILTLLEDWRAVFFDTLPFFQQSFPQETKVLKELTASSSEEELKKFIETPLTAYIKIEKETFHDLTLQSTPSFLDHRFFCDYEKNLTHFFDTSL